MKFRYPLDEHSHPTMAGERALPAIVSSLPQVIETLIGLLIRFMRGSHAQWLVGEIQLTF